MDFINLMGATWPGGLWASLIKIFYSFITNYAWAIVVFTICLKILLSPVDFLQRRSTAKMQKANAKIQPELDKLQKKYGANPQILRQKQAELYKKNNVNMGGSCIVMILYLVSTLVIFMTLFNSLGVISRFKITDQYDQLKATYYNSVEIDTTDKTTTQLIEQINSLSTEQKATAEQAVVDKYMEIKDSWLWVNNIWISDSVANRIPDFNAYLGASGTNFEVVEGGPTLEEQKTIAKTEYDAIMNKLLKEHNGPNGYYILSVLTVLVSVLTQVLTTKLMQPKQNKQTSPFGKQENTKTKPNWFMLIFLPATMLIFTLTSSAAFSVYILFNSLISTLLIPVTMGISNAIDKKQDKKQQELTKVDYRR